MLTPEYLNLIEFNDVVELYNRLNIEITADIISRISVMNDITSVSKKQMKILLQTNGTEIFNEALEKTLALTNETKNALKLLFENMAKEDMQGYKELYEYRGKPFKLSEIQYKILNQGLKQTHKTLKNMTNTIAFQSQQAYVKEIDEAYMKAVTGAFNYNTAINIAVQRLADQGITLKDKLGRNVQLEVAVRRNVLSGIHETANSINRDIEESLGCNGYEVTAHLGARPTHAEAQGQQYAINVKDAEKYNLGLWSDVADLWEEYNCRHTYFGIILGISEPIYNNKELKEFKNTTVTLNGKQVPYYKATQIQRSYENNIRKIKRSIQTLDKAGIDSSKQKSKLRQLQMKQTAFCKETGLQKDYSRMKIAKINANEQVKHRDITEQFNSAKRYKIEQQQYYKDTQGNKYTVDGKYVLMKPSNREKEVAEIIGKIYGGIVKIIPRINKPEGIKTPDYMIENKKYDLKEIYGNSKNTLYNAINKKKEQSDNFIFDISNTKMEISEAIKQIQGIYESKHKDWVNEIILMKNNQILKIYRRK